MMNPEDIKINHIYGNGKGMYRKVRRFEDTQGNPSTKPIDIVYVRCTDIGAVSENAKEQVCYVTTFMQWAKEHKGDAGNVQPDDNVQYKRMEAALNNILNLSLDAYAVSQARYGLGIKSNENREVTHEPNRRG